MKRYTITLGATTTVGGKVISASSNGSIDGALIALEGDMILCPACKSQGKIQCIEPRIPEVWNGKKVALENDLCLCRCPAPPRLVPNQTLRFQNLSGLGEGKAAAFSRENPAMRSGANTSYDERFVLLDEDTNLPIAHAEYAIRRASGKLEYGVTDAEGRTHLLAATVEAETIDIYA